MKKYLIYFILIFLGAIWVLWAFNQLIVSPSDSKSTVSFEIKEGDSVFTVSDNLKVKKLIKSPFVFVTYSYLTGNYSKLKSGTYKVSPSLNTNDLIKIFVEGPEDEVVTIIPGTTLEEIGDLLDKSGIVERNDFIKADPKNYVTEYPFLSGAKDFEGFIMPDTYRFKLDMTAGQVLTIILDNFKTKVGSLLPTKDPEKIIIIASLIEKEVISDSDRKLVSGIIQRRLSIGMPLQIDATIVYWVCGKRFFDCDKVTIDDYKKDFSYNTYTNKWLPPGPISNPSVSSIKAAISPQKSDYLYYLSDPRTQKTIFSKTFEEHNNNRARYLGL